MEMKKEIKDKVVNTNQKYLEKFLSQDVPEKLEKQLENMDWSYIDMINDKEQKRGTFSPLEAMEISKIESNRSKYTDIGIDAIKNTKVGAILLAGFRSTGPKQPMPSAEMFRSLKNAIILGMVSAGVRVGILTRSSISPSSLIRLSTILVPPASNAPKRIIRFRLLCDVIMSFLL